MNVKENSPKTHGTHRFSSGAYQVFMLVLCSYALATLGYGVIAKPSAEIKQVLKYSDYFVCAVFLIDFVISFVKAPNRLRYLYTWGWIDLASSIPVVPWLRWGRVARILRVVQLFRTVRATKTITRFVLEKRAQGTFLAAALLSMLSIFLGSVAILQVEKVPGSNIHGPGDAIWWAFTTVTSANYGSHFPVTTEGRLIASLLTLVGAALFGALAGSVAMWFFAPSQEKERREVGDLREDIAELKRMIEASKNNRTV